MVRNSSRSDKNGTSYFRTPVPELNDSDDKATELRINCCGETVADYDFKEDYGARGRNDFYIIHVTSGALKMFLNDREILIGKDEFICIKEHTPFIFSPVSPEKRTLCYYWIHFTGYGAKEALTKSDILTNTLYKLENPESVYEQYERLFFESRHCRKNLEYVISVELRNVLLKLGRAKSADDSLRLDLSMSYIHSHIREELSITKLAAMEFLGVSRYRELFKEIMGCSPTDYILRLRIMKAKDLLTQPNIGIAEVAERVGYRDRLYFQRVFKKCVGVTPGEYRDRYR